MEAQRQEKSRLRRKVEMEVAHSKGKEKEVHVEFKTSLYHMTEEESEYNLTPHTITTT